MGSAGGVFWARARWDGVAGFVAVLLLAAFAVAARLRGVSAPLSAPGRLGGSAPR